MADLILGIPKGLIDGWRNEASGEYYDGAALKVIAGRRSAFGDNIFVTPRRIVHILPTNGLTNQITVNTFNTGTVDTIDGKLRAKTGTGQFSFAAALSDTVPYKTGAGIRADFTARFSGPTLLTQQIAGFTSATDGPGFAFDDYEGISTFGILIRSNGENEIQELKFTAAATGAEVAVIEINGNNYNVPLTAGTVQHNAYEAATYLDANVPLFRFRSVDDTVVVFGQVARPSTGAYSYTSGGTSAASFTIIKSGVSPNEKFIPQKDWNVDTRLGPVHALDPTKLNVYSVSLQYLGAGNMFFYIEHPETGQFELVHMEKYAGLYNVPSLSDANMRIGITAALLGSTEDTSVESASISGFIDGDDRITSEPGFLENTVIGVGTTDVNLLTIRNRLVRGDRANRIILHITRITGFTESVKGATIKVLRGASVAGSPNFQYVDKALSIVDYDTSGTTVTGGEQIGALKIGFDGFKELNGSLDIHVHPGEAITFAGSVRKTPVAEMDITVEFLEDI